MTRSPLSQRKPAELALKLDGLDDELEGWRRLTRSGGLARHSSQVQLITGILLGEIERARTTLGAVRGSDTEIVDACGALQRDVVDLNRIWEFFRVKLEQRFVGSLNPFLIAADELAWDCYRAAQDAAGGPAREPPLTFLNGGASPFVQARGARFADEGSVRGQTLRGLVEQLPVSVIGLPWHQLQHLPDALVICHEAGHAVEDDFGLAKTVDAHVAEAARTHPDVWRGWARELFADVYGTLAAGPAYTGCLADFCARSRRAVTQAEAEPEYPTPTLRVLASAAVCELCGCDAEPVVDEWQRTFPTHRLPDYAKEAAAVACAVAEGTYPSLGGRALLDVIDFDADSQRAATQEAGRLRTGRELQLREIRPLIAAARLAFERRPGDYGGAVLAHVSAHITVARRRSGRRPSAAEVLAAGARLRARLERTHEEADDV